MNGASKSLKNENRVEVKTYIKEKNSMSKRLVMNCKKATPYLLVGICSLGTIIPATQLHAKTIGQVNRI